MTHENELLDEFCEVIRLVAAAPEQYASGEVQIPSTLFAGDADRQDFINLMKSETAAKICMRLVRHAATSAIFHTLVIFDEKAPLAGGRACASIILTSDGNDVPSANYLHELLGEVMDKNGMETDEWW